MFVIHTVTIIHSFIHAITVCEDCVVLLKTLFARQLHPYVLFANNVVVVVVGVVPVHCSIFLLGSQICWFTQKGSQTLKQNCDS
jgi:hypothetical protein